MFLALILLAFGLVLFTNKLTIELSFVGAFLAATYPFVKRYTYLPQVYLGLRIRLVDPDGVRSGERRRPEEVPGHTAVVWIAFSRQRLVFHDLRHGIRDGGSRRRYPRRREIHGYSFRRRGSGHPRRVDGHLPAGHADGRATRSFAAGLFPWASASPRCCSCGSNGPCASAIATHASPRFATTPGWAWHFGWVLFWPMRSSSALP